LHSVDILPDLDHLIKKERDYKPRSVQSAFIVDYLCWMAACAAASLAMGTRKGEQLT
jgi:hypothetical protein